MLKILFSVPNTYFLSEFHPFSFMKFEYKYNLEVKSMDSRIGNILKN